MMQHNEMIFEICDEMFEIAFISQVLNLQQL